MRDELLPAADGVGPLLQRDYWAVLDGCPLSPSGVMEHVKTHFCALPPASIVQFQTQGRLDCDAELEVRISAAAACRVRVIHADAQSLTLGTLRGHPEAGRITFGAYRNAADDVIFHIRSRARSASASKLFGFLAIGEAMQTNTWTDFINNVAAGVGARIRDVIHAETRRVEERPDDQLSGTPTFAAAGD